MISVNAPSGGEKLQCLSGSLALCAIVLAAGCKPKTPGSPSHPEGDTGPEVPAEGSITWQPLAPRGSVQGPRFTEIGTERSGVDFANRWRPVGNSAEELTGPFAGGGVAIGDYDADGKPDLYLTRPQGGSRLFRNLGDWRFEDVTARAGVEDPELHGTGASFADIDNDGDLDLHVCCYDGPNRVYINQGDGTFVERAAAMGLDLQRATDLGELVQTKLNILNQRERFVTEIVKYDEIVVIMNKPVFQDIRALSKKTKYVLLFVFSYLFFFLLKSMYFNIKHLAEKK